MRGGMVTIPWRLFAARAALAALYLCGAGFAAYSVATLHSPLPSTVLLIALCWAGVRKVQLASRHLDSSKLQSAQTFLADNPSSIHALILRPFGADGSIVVRKYPWLLSPRYMLEELIEDAVQSELHCKCYSLVDPKAGLLTMGPEYLLSDHDQWRTHVDALLKNTRVAFVLLLPGLGVTGSLLWELSRLVELKFAGRLIIVLPPPRHAGYESALKALSMAMTVFSAGAKFRSWPLMVYPEYDGSITYWRLNRKTSGGRLYRKALAAAEMQSSEGGARGCIWGTI